ncbi:MAG: FAD-dependent oxidoreductase, partial [Saprospiraceae bacterium]|nr:FAD-dependent oxidoreductase [Saprospiraceae bacterium]
MQIKKHFLKCDILVAGGGAAGVPTALAAARNGAKVILCQDRPVLGGNASSEVRMHIVGADCSGKRGAELSVEARETGIVEEIRLENCIKNPQRSASMFDLILYDMCRVEPTLELMLNTRIYEAVVENNHICKALARRDSTEEEFEVEASIFIDCTGDGTLGASAGAPFYEGRESKVTFSESLGQQQPDLQRLGSSLMFQARKYDRAMPFVAPSWARKFTEADLRLRPHATKALDLDVGLEYGYWWLEWGGDLDTIRDNEVIRDELLAILMGVWDHVKNGGDHGADHWALEWCGFLPGKRESRRFIGQYTLTQNDIIESRSFDDAIAYGGWHMDLHPPKGVDAADEPPCIHHLVPHLYDIPLRICISNHLDNLMFAGRNVSASHVAFASTRVMATCASIGQGVGTAAAIAIRDKVLPKQFVSNSNLIRELQQTLLRDGVFIIGKRNEDSQDLARDASITCSGQQPEGPAINVTSGITRSVHGDNGVPVGRTEAGTHRWMSSILKEMPAWIELRWQEP